MLTKDIGLRKRALGLWLKGNNFTRVGLAMGKSRQRVCQLLIPPPLLRLVVYNLARGKCQECGVQVGRNGHYHSEPSGEYDDFTQPLTLLCLACHRPKHIGGEPISQ